MTTDTSSASETLPKRVPSLAILIVISTVSPVSMNIFLPSLSGMVDAFSTTTAKVQLTMSLYFVAIAIAQIFLGPLSDRYGRRPVILLGMGLYTVGSVMCLLAPTIEALILARLVQAVGGCTGLTLGRAIIRDLHERDKAASMIGYVTMGMAIGPMLAPVLGGFLDGFYGWVGGFYLMVLLGVGVFVAAIFNLHETNHRKAKNGGISGLWRNYASLGSHKLFWAYSLTAMFTSSLFFAYIGGAPFIAAGMLGMSPKEMGLYFMFVAAGYIIGNGISGRVSGRVGVLKMVLVGSVLPALAIVALVFLSWEGFAHPLALFVPMFFIGLGNGICLPSALSGAVSVQPELAGAASGLSGSLQIGLGALTSALVAWMLSDSMWPNTVWPMVAVMAVCMVAAWVCVGAAMVFERHDSN
ncbi:multidrug effflux MFS transporter [Roseibium algae]|uniref:Bcr/CflA family efflux transporter n=1 Tax=Roseibium algae TaxID=3123038 RepID=A0ABU8TKK1_9HYPH